MAAYVIAEIEVHAPGTTRPSTRPRARSARKPPEGSWFLSKAS